MMLCVVQYVESMPGLWFVNLNDDKRCVIWHGWIGIVRLFDVYILVGMVSLNEW